MKPDENLKNCFPFWIETIHIMEIRESQGLPVNEGILWVSEEETT